MEEANLLNFVLLKEWNLSQVEECVRKVGKEPNPLVGDGGAGDENSHLGVVVKELTPLVV